MKATHSIESGSSVTTTRVSAGTLVDNWMDPPSRQLTWRVSQLSRALDEFGTYIDDNAGAIVNYGERRRCGVRISTGFVESTINQRIAKRFVKKQQMRWTPRGAHLLLQVRVHVLNDELGAAFQRWYPKLDSGQNAQLAA
jgi:hypothetical protein